MPMPTRARLAGSALKSGDRLGSDSADALDGVLENTFWAVVGSQSPQDVFANPIVPLPQIQFAQGI